MTIVVDTSVPWTRMPSSRCVMAVVTATTAGTRNSRATMAACERSPPTSVTTPADRSMAPVHAGEVV